MSLLFEQLTVYILLTLVLLQTFSREVLVVDYALNRTSITARFCINKARPELHCDGKCYFSKQLKKQQEREDKLPNPLKERLEMLPATFFQVPSRPASYPVIAIRYPHLLAPHAPSLGLRAIFRPPQARA
jgi:hypothetical protein